MNYPSGGPAANRPAGRATESRRTVRRSKAEIYHHLVWTTSARAPAITPEVERAIHRCIESEARRIGCDVLAINGMPDHVHLVVKMPTKLSSASLAHQVKGVSSHFLHEKIDGMAHFRWQAGYAVFSIS